MHSTKALDYKIVDNFFRAHPNSTFQQFRKAHPRFEISSSSFTRRRDWLKNPHKKAVKTIKGYHRINYNIVDEFIKTHPAAKFSEFKTANPGISICSMTFVNRKKHLLGKSSGTITKKPQVFTRLWSKEYKESDLGMIDIIKELLCSLQKSGRASKGLEVSRQVDPNIIEVREAVK